MGLAGRTRFNRQTRPGPLLVNFTNVVFMPRLRRIKGMGIPRNLARRIKGMDIFRNLANRHSAVRIQLNPNRTRDHNLSPEDIMKALTPPTIAGSQLDRATKTWQSNEYELIHTSLYNKPEQFENIILKASADGEILQLKDVGRVDMAPPFFDISTDIDGHPATTIVLKPLPGWSAAIAIEALEKDLEELKAAAFPRGMNFEVTPLDSRDMIYAVVETPRYSTLEYTSARCSGLGAIARGVDGITSVSSLAGYELRTEDRDSTAGTCLIHLKDRSDRKLISRQIIETLEERGTQRVKISGFGDHRRFGETFGRARGEIACWATVSRTRRDIWPQVSRFGLAALQLRAEALVQLRKLAGEALYSQLRPFLVLHRVNRNGHTDEIACRKELDLDGAVVRLDAGQKIHDMRKCQPFVRREFGKPAPVPMTGR
jgi:AcrB/AcrD/AcrF family